MNYDNLSLLEVLEQYIKSLVKEDVEEILKEKE